MYLWWFSYERLKDELQRCKEVAFDDMVARLLFSQYNASIKNIPVIKMRMQGQVSKLFSKVFGKKKKKIKKIYLPAFEYLIF